MRIKLAATCFLIGTLLVPIASYADTDKDRSSPKDFVKDSVITTKIKAKLAEAKLSSAVHIKVDTDNKGVVNLNGTAKSQAEADQAGSIARGVEGVTLVNNNINVGKEGSSARVGKEGSSARVAKGGSSARAARPSSEDRVEARISDMHAKLQITQAQEEQWSKVALVMRDNAKEMDGLTKTRAERANMNAIEDLKSYGEIAAAHAEGIKKLTPVFETLYGTMSDTQKKNADSIFDRGDRRGDRHGDRKGSRKHR